MSTNITSLDQSFYQQQHRKFTSLQAAVGCSIWHLLIRLSFNQYSSCNKATLNYFAEQRTKSWSQQRKNWL